MGEAANMKEKLLKRKYEIEERGRKLKVEKAVTEEACEILWREWGAKEKEVIEKNTEIAKCDADLEQVNKALNVIKEEELKKRKEEVKIKNKENNILVVGDSMFGSRHSRDFRDLITQSIGLIERPISEVVSLSGKGTSQIKERAIRQLGNGNFGTVVINGGVNDCRRNWNIEGIAGKVKEMMVEVDKVAVKMGMKHQSYVNILPVPDKRGKQNADIMKVNEESNKVAKEIGWSVVHANHYYSTELGEPNSELFRDRINRSQPPNFGNRKLIEKDIHLSTVTRGQGQFSGAQILAMKIGQTIDGSQCLSTMLGN